MKMKENKREMKGNEKGKKLSDPSPFNSILNNIQFLLAVVSNKAFLSLSWDGGVEVLVSLCKWKGRKTKGNENGKEKKLSDPSPFNNILNNIQFLLVVVSIKHTYF